MIDKRVIDNLMADKRMKYPYQTRMISSVFHSFVIYSFVVVSVASLLNANLHADPVRFSLDVLPILSEHCLHCHGPDEKSREADLRLDTEAGATGGESPAIFRGKSEESELVRRILSTDPEEVMPPPSSKHKLKKEQIAILRKWIDEGAHWGGHWAFEPVKRPTVPDAGKGWAVNDIDRFIAAGHEKAGIKPVADADRRTLIRRATFDLTGLPPTAEEVDAFLADKSDDAFAKLVNRLLDSQAYGERWGRHWLDLARYADTAGDNPDYPIPQAWRYRNYVIDAFNADMPYDQFLREQIAGDLIPAESEAEHHRMTIGTGFIALSRRFGGGTKEKIGNQTIEDTINTIGQATMGLSLSCARCHDHKFDPIPTRDYYALYGFFESTQYPSTRQGMDTIVKLIKPETYAALIGDKAGPMAEIEEKIGKLSVQYDFLVARNRPTMMVEKQLDEAQAELDELKKDWPEIPEAYAVQDGEKCGDAAIQIRGDQFKKGEKVPRGFLEVLGGQKIPPQTAGSGRMELAKWIADEKNPLTARVIVNRLWHYHFGQGIVASTNDFGSRGSIPTHPELLDWLASWLVEEKWSLKQMHRLIMLSRTYQLSADHSPESFQRDPNNALVWHRGRQRLNAEETRDAMMFVSGVLDAIQAESHPFPKTGRLTEHAPFRGDFETKHRSVYVMQQRNRRNPYFEVFDGANTSACTGERSSSITSLQALYQVNSPEVAEWSRKAAAKVRSRSEAAAQVSDLYRLVLARSATEEEIADGVAYLKRFENTATTEKAPFAQPLASLARVLFASNEFMFIE
jgi:hypothetical protein